MSPAQWAAVKPFVPPATSKRKVLVDDRYCFEGLLWRLAHQCRWADIPTARFGSAYTCWSRHARWRRCGALAAMWAAYLRTLAPEPRAAWVALVAAHGFAPVKVAERPRPPPIPRVYIERIALSPKSG